MNIADEKEQDVALKMISEIETIPEINAAIWRINNSKNILMNQYKSLFDALSLLDERTKALKDRAAVLFDYEGAKTYPDSENFGTLTLVKGRRYIPIDDAEKTLDEDTFNALVKIGASWIKWTPPKESGQDE